ncbi:hypothetical protein [Algoriphagus sp. AK58]|uniref:hypothetical protein n=1 Tax=Algoriphagus sp. AK58 TaxID=1406877 RepID=UPI00164F05AF|nr:hypothetical protein [Algoriphagus sp. AK58]MBC6366959.1 hypothetical protein [Algoriphagus sp. AK58]
MENSLKLELIEKLLKVNEEQILLEVKSVLDQTFLDSKIPNELYNELVQRRERAIKGESKLYSWKEIKTELLNK